MEGEKKRGRSQKRSSDSSESSIPLELRRLDVKQRNQTLFSERTHPHRESSQINLRIVLDCVKNNVVFFNIQRNHFIYYIKDFNLLYNRHHYR
jgi:hypothetical protein